MEGVKDILIEHPIDVPELNVKGFIDVVVIMESGEVYVYDIKTVGSWSWKYKFGRKKEGNPSIHQELQLGTYGYAIKEEFGRCDGLFLLCYNKDTSVMKEVPVNIDFINQSYNFWTRVQDLHKNNNLPPLQDGESPVMAWECKYCNFKEICDERA